MVWAVVGVGMHMHPNRGRRCCKPCWIECLEDQPEKAKEHQYAHEDDPPLLKFTIDDGLGGCPSADLISTCVTELGIIPHVGAAAGAVGALVIAAEAFQIVRAGTSVMHGASIPYIGRG